MAGKDFSHIEQAECSGSDGRVLDWGSRVASSSFSPVESMCCVLEQDTLSAT